MTDDERREALLTEMEALSGRPSGVRRFFGNSQLGVLEATVLQMREGKAALDKVGAQAAQWYDGKLETVE